MRRELVFVIAGIVRYEEFYISLFLLVCYKVKSGFCYLEEPEPANFLV